MLQKITDEKLVHPVQLFISRSTVETVLETLALIAAEATSRRCLRVHMCDRRPPRDFCPSDTLHERFPHVNVRRIVCCSNLGLHV